MKVNCKHCKHIGDAKLIKKHPHIGAYCRNCGKWDCWVDQKTAAAWRWLFGDAPAKNARSN